jgi:xanthine dehydrogenase YagR molybdenum-binding subunit
MEKAMQTIAHYMPDAKRDPLLDQNGYLGRDLERVDAEAKVKGAARFTAEFHPENLAHAVLVHSTIAKGKVSRLNTSRAEGAPGVVQVITHRNMPKLKAPPLVDLGDLKKGMAASDLPILQDASVHWDGQPIAIVVAETLEQAEQAAAMVEAEYETAGASVSFEGAKPRAEAPADVMGEPAVLKIGDFVKAYEAADVRVNHVYRTPRYNHNAIEPHATIAFWEDDGELIVFESSQSVNTAARTLAHIFNLDWDKVRVLAPYVGGGFGGKGGLWNHTPLCAAAAKVVKRPVKLALSREGVYRVIGGRTPADQRIALGANRSGELTAVMHSAVTGTTSHGRYAEQCTCPVRHMWKAPNLFVEQKIVNLDTVTNTWMRAPGESIGTFALESALDELAYALRMDPIELRRRNEPDKDPTKGTPFSSRQLMEAYRRGAEKFGWATRNPEPRSQRDGKWMVGQGVATAYYPYYRFPATVRMRLSADGKALVQAPAAEMGMGTATVQIQHAADRLGVPLANVTFEYGDSRLPDTPLMAGGSNQTATMVAAVRTAVEELQKEVLKLAQ